MKMVCYAVCAVEVVEVQTSGPQKKTYFIESTKKETKILECQKTKLSLVLPTCPGTLCS